MARHGRSVTRPRVTFFSFQDIITCVTGMLILIVILMAIQLKDTHSNPNHSAEQTALQKKRDKATKVLTEVQKEIEMLQQLFAGGKQVDLSQIKAQVETLSKDVNQNSSRMLAKETDLKKLQDKQ